MATYTHTQITRNMWTMKVNDVASFVVRYNPSVSAGTGFVNSSWEICKVEDYKMHKHGVCNGQPVIKMTMTNSKFFKSQEKMNEWMKGQ